MTLSAFKSMLSKISFFLKIGLTRTMLWEDIWIDFSFVSFEKLKERAVVAALLRCQEIR